MGAMASRITSITIVYSTVYSDADQRKPSKLRVTGLCAGNSPVTGEFPARRASNADNVSIGWRHHVTSYCLNSLLLIVFIGGTACNLSHCHVKTHRCHGNAMAWELFLHPWWRHPTEKFSALCFCVLCGEFTDHRWIPRTTVSDAELWCFL